MGNKPINKPLRGIRDNMPPGYVVGRTGNGSGPPILLPIGNFASKAYVAGTTIQVGGAAGGDLSGSYPNPTVAKINGNAVKAGTPSNNQVLTYITADTEWEPETPHYVPAGGTTGQVLEKNSNTDYDLTWGSASSGSPSSVYDDGTTLEFALTDPSGQLILDPSGNPIFAPIVLPASALPTPGASSLGGVKSLAAVSHNFLTSITTAGLPVAAQPASTDLSDYSNNNFTPTDGSTAGLTFAAVSANGTVIGNMVFLSMQITYPSTASGSGAVIASLPYTASNQKYANTVALCETSATLTYPVVAQMVSGTATLILVDGLTGAQIADSVLSGQTINITISYPLV